MYFGPNPLSKRAAHNTAYFLTSADLSLKADFIMTWICSKKFPALWVINTLPAVNKVPFRTFECWWERFNAKDLTKFTQCWPIESLNLSHMTLIKLFDAYQIKTKHYMLDFCEGIVQGLGESVGQLRQVPYKGIRVAINHLF
jgi:hypothetical protein